MTLSLACALCAAFAASSARGAMIPVFIVAGQSNATGYRSNVGLLTPAQQTPQPKVLYAGVQTSAVAWNQLSPPTEPSNTMRIYANMAGFGPEAALGKTVLNLEQYDATVGIVKYSINGSNLYNDWNPSHSGPFQANSYVNMKSRVQEALSALPLQHNGDTGYVAGFFWMQGEADSVAGRTTAQYEADLTALINELRIDFGPNLPFIMGQINNSDVGPNNTMFSGPNTAAVRQAQMDIASNMANGSAAKIANTFLVMTDAFERQSDDPLHFDSTGEMQLGQAMGQAFLTLTPEPGGLAGMALAGMLFSTQRRRGHQNGCLRGD